MMIWSGCLAALYLVCLWALLPLDDVELDLIAFFQRFVSIELDRAIVHEDVGPIVSSDETIALRVVEPLDLAFVLGHVSVTSLQSRFERATRGDRGRGDVLLFCRASCSLCSRWARCPACLPLVTHR